MRTPWSTRPELPPRHPLRGTRAAALGASPVVLALVAATAACEPLAESWEPGSREAVPVYRRESPAAAPAPLPSPRTLRVMAWNIKYGAGRIDFWFDEWGDRVQMARAEVDANLAGVYRLVNEVKPDILLAEEIEVNSRRSAYVNMVRGILENTDLGYGAYFSTWRSRYIPSEGVGRMELGNAIFSRYPIRSAERIAQVDRTDQDAATRYFYIHRAVGRAVIDVGRDVAALVVHTEAYDKDGTKQKQLAQVQDLMQAETGRFVIGGDFNSLPPTSVKTEGFNDESPKAKGTEFEQPPYDLAEMRPFYQAFVPHIDLARYGADHDTQRRYFTHSVIGRNRIGANGEPGFWTRTLDYLFVRAPDSWMDGSTDVLQQKGDAGLESDPMELSDHCPVLGTWVIAP